MNEIITEKNYPIQGLWIFKSMFLALLGVIFFIFYFFISYKRDRTASIYSEINFYIIIIIGFLIFSFTALVGILRRTNFHYSVEKKFLTLKQGILSKQQSHIPYGVIQNLLVKQDLLDRILGLASLVIENASYGAGALASLQHKKTFRLSLTNKRPSENEIVGLYGNKVIIPGLTKTNATLLKSVILQKMKKNPMADSQSGL